MQFKAPNKQIRLLLLVTSVSDSNAHQRSDPALRQRSGAHDPQHASLGVGAPMAATTLNMGTLAHLSSHRAPPMPIGGSPARAPLS
jgi:hypothetical protein